LEKYVLSFPFLSIFETVIAWREEKSAGGRSKRYMSAKPTIDWL